MQIPQDLELLNEQVQEQSQYLDRIEAETSKVIIGQQHMIDSLMLGLLAKGHILLEGLPGLAKTLAIKTLSATVNADFQRIQFTPDLLPADVVGTLIYNPATSDFTVRKGPIFSNFVLADEINRAPAKVQSALLEAMQERQVTIGNDTFTLDEPFLVLATQNPIEQEGTYPLPEAQVDRFMLKVIIDYPEMDEERQIVQLHLGKGIQYQPQAVVEPSQILEMRQWVQRLYMDEKVVQYILHLVFATRNPTTYHLSELAPLISYGGSPRASINLALASKAKAFMEKRAYVIPEDVQAVLPDVLRHRIGLTYEAEAENISQDEIIRQLLNTVEIP